MVFGITRGALPLTHRTIPFPNPIIHGRVIGFQLPNFIIGMPRLTSCGELHFNPIVESHHRRVGIPFTFPLLNNLKFLPEPIKGGANQLI